ncbi:MAG TPA: hypothetical protein VIU12_30140 [Chryseolinea sp.]
MITPSNPFCTAGHPSPGMAMILKVVLSRLVLVLFITCCLHNVYAQLSETVKVFLPDKDHAKLYRPNFIIRWKSVDDGTFYQVTLKDLFEDELLKIETAGNSVNVDWRDPKIADTEALLVEVQIKGNDCSKSPPTLVRKLAPNERAGIDKLMATQPNVREEEMALGKFVRALFYEEHHLLIDALTAYEHAIALAPDVLVYRQAYHAFLVRNKMDGEE